jgi:hypothetical protein
MKEGQGREIRRGRRKGRKGGGEKEGRLLSNHFS